MGKQSAERFSEDDYFAEPDYDKFTDEELDELYSFGEIRAASMFPERAGKPVILKSVEKPELEFSKDIPDIELDYDESFDFYESEVE